MEMFASKSRHIRNCPQMFFGGDFFRFAQLHGFKKRPKIPGILEIMCQWMKLQDFFGWILRLKASVMYFFLPWDFEVEKNRVPNSSWFFVGENTTHPRATRSSLPQYHPAKTLQVRGTFVCHLGGWRRASDVWLAYRLATKKINER